MGLISNATTIFDAGAISAGLGGSMTFIKKLTASSSGTLSFVNGASGVVLDNTYKEYLFTFKNMHPSANGPYFQVNFRDGGTNYDAPKTTAFFAARHKEDDSASAVAYITGNDLAEGTGAQFLDGFGINNEIQVNAICKIADGAVVGSSLIKIIEENLGQNEKILNLIGNFVKDLKSGTNL